MEIHGKHNQASTCHIILPHIFLFEFIGLSFDTWFNRCPPPTNSHPPGTSECNLFLGGK